MATYQKTILSYPVTCKSKKSTAQEIFSRLSRLEDIQDHFRELTGIVGGEERSSILWAPMGLDPKPLLDPDQFKADCNGLLAGLPVLTMQDKPVLMGILAKAEEIFQEHVPVIDSRRIPEDEQNRRAEQAIQREEQAKKAEEQNALDTIKRQELLKTYDYLDASPDCDGNYDQVKVAKNIKTELQHNYPGQKFSVKSSSFSMGNDVTVSWIDGPGLKVFGGLKKPLNVWRMLKD